MSRDADVDANPEATRTHTGNDGGVALAAADVHESRLLVLLQETAEKWQISADGRLSSSQAGTDAYIVELNRGDGVLAEADAHTGLTALGRVAPTQHATRSWQQHKKSAQSRNSADARRGEDCARIAGCE